MVVHAKAKEVQQLLLCSSIKLSLFISYTHFKMELEEPEDDEWNWKSGSTNNNKYYWSESDDGNGGKGSWVLNLGKKVLVAGLVATSAPIVVPPLFVASAIGVVASVPYVFFLASHACTRTLMSRLLPFPHQHQYDLLLDEEQFGMDGAENVIMNCEKYLISSDGGYEQGVVKDDESHSPDARHNVSEENDQEIEEENSAGRILVDDGEVIGDDVDDGIGMEEGLSGEGNGEQPMSAGQGVVITIEDIDENEVVEEFKAPFDVTTVFVEQFGDKAIEGEIDEEELKRETKGLLEDIRDEGRTDDEGEYVNGIHGDINENKQEVDPVVENSAVACNTHSSNTMEGIIGLIEKEEIDKSLCEQEIPPRNTENKDNIYYDCVESDDPIRNVLEDGEVDSMQKSNDPIRDMLEDEEVVSTSILQEQLGENSELLSGTSSQQETLPAEPVRDLEIDQNCNIPLVEESAEVISGNIVLDVIVDEELDQELDGPTVSQGVKLDNISASVNQEHQLPMYDEILDSSEADSNAVSGENGFDLSDEKAIGPGAGTCTIELHEESSVVMVNGHAALIEVTDSSVEIEREQECRPSEISSGKDAMRTSDEVMFNEESMWKQITVIRKIIGYEGSKHKSCIDELKALYIFTGVEFPAFVKENPYDPSEINEKLHFLMSIVGIKSNAD
ncbi:hypothetical protein PIB30_020357 [Stylosanthes scabra]|uniref:Transmembrane protein n=1 Tax=Stylosanthes scabra TaxID=79078 RepID=A0ABU6Z5Y5_9FABA|nr:hypothetical protein [Stylosanthes scabra]